jgi:hypothetical protein
MAAEEPQWFKTLNEISAAAVRFSDTVDDLENVIADLKDVPAADMWGFDLKCAEVRRNIKEAQTPRAPGEADSHTS